MAYAVITRDLGGAALYTPVLRPIGLEVVAMPVTQTSPPRDPAALGDAIRAGGFAAVLVASARAADALARARGHAVLPPVWAVGPATARALAAAGIAATLPPTAHDAASLATAFIGERSRAGQRVLVPRAEEGRDELFAALRAAGVEVVDITAYRTVATAGDDPALGQGRALLTSGGAAVCAVFAPSQVTALAALVGPLEALSTVFAAIGETTAAALHAAGIATMGVAETPTPEGLAKAISAVYPPR